MPGMTDPSVALKSFQKAFLLGGLELQRCDLDPDLRVHVDLPEGNPRLTYVRFDGETVIALVILAITVPLDGTHCFGVGYAVPKAYRNQGYAKGTVSAAIAELQQGLARDSGISEFYVEAIVGADNTPSRRVAELTISSSPVAVTDQVSGLPAFQYVRKLTATRAG